MSQTILYRLFGLGRLPRPMVPVLEREGIVLRDEGIGGSITFRKFRAPGRRSRYRRNWFSGSLVVTELRFAAFAYSKPLINLPVEPAQLSKLEGSLEKDGAVLCVAFEASVFQDDASGRVECRFRTPRARSYLEKIRST